MCDNRKKLILRAIWFLVFGIIIVLLLSGCNKTYRIVDYNYTKCNTLWELLKYCPEDMDIHIFLDEIRELNAIENDIVYSNRLYQVPVYEEE